MMPRPYLTWSRLDLFERDPAAYRRQYILGEPLVTNEYIEFGKRFAQELQHREGTLWEYARLWFPDYPRREYGISAPCDVCRLYARYDAFDPKQGKIGEYKTGKKWDQRRVDGDSQLTFYAFVYHLKFNTLPSEIALHWAETTWDEQGALTLSGKMLTFPTERNTEDFSTIYARIKHAWEGIAKLPPSPRSTPPRL